MWLSTLTADAASRHGHEFSSRPSPAPGLPISRSPLSVLSAARQKAPLSLPPVVPGKSILRHKRSRSLQVTMAELREESEADLAPTNQHVVDDDDDLDAHLSKMRIPGAFYSHHSRSRSLLDVRASLNVEPPRPASALGHASRTQLPTDKNDTQDFSVPALCQKRAARSKTHYRLAQPPPVAASKQINKHIRPRVLLQLQQQTVSGFHRPVYEVVPASRFASNTKVGQKLNMLHKFRDRQLAPDDLVVMQAEDYKTSDACDDDPDFCDGRTVLGVVCVATEQDGLGPEGAFICLENSTWKATPQKDGRYDLSLQGNEAQQARWYVPKAQRRRSASLVPAPESVDDRKFYFATIQQNSSKHPTIASMSHSHLDVYDSYVPVAASNDAASTAQSQQDTVATDDALRRLIVVSSAWVFFKQGWSSYFGYQSDFDATPCPFTSPAQLPHQRAASVFVDDFAIEQLHSRRDSTSRIAKLVRPSLSSVRSYKSSSSSSSIGPNRHAIAFSTPSTSPVERSSSPTYSQTQKVGSVQEKVAAIGTHPNLTFVSRLATPPSSPPKQVTFAGLPPLSPVLDSDASTIEDSEHSDKSDSPIASPYWKEFDNLSGHKVEPKTIGGMRATVKRRFSIGKEDAKSFVTFSETSYDMADHSTQVVLDSSVESSRDPRSATNTDHLPALQRLDRLRLKMKRLERLVKTRTEHAGNLTKFKKTA